MSTNTSQVPQQIGNYDLISKIAEGGMGAVYKGKNRNTGQIVAIKIIPTETAKNPVLLRRFEQEFKAATLIDHPNVVKALDYCGTGATPFLVMEFVDGESLGQRVERDGPMAEAAAVRLISQVCEGLHRAHKQGLIHRDVKPDNILVTRDGGIAKLTDLGLVKDVEGEMNLTRTGRGLGTPHFMAPEQFRNAKNADVRCDVYSLGATLYTMLTGVVPFAKTSPLDCWMRKTKDEFPEPKKLNPRISDRVNWAVCRAMKADPNARPASCREFMEDLTGGPWKAGSGLIPVSAGDSTRVSSEDLWYMVYKDETGAARTVKGTTDSIRKNIMAGSLGDTEAILVGRTKTGQFLPVKSVPEFRDLVVHPSGAFPSIPPSDGSSPPSSGSFVQRPGRTPTRLPAPTPAPHSSGRLPPAPSPDAPTEPYRPLQHGQLPATRAGSGTGTHHRASAKSGPTVADILPWVITALAAAAAVGMGAYVFFAR